MAALLLRRLLLVATVGLAATASAAPAAAQIHPQPVSGGDVLLDATGDATGARDIARVTLFRAGEERLGVAMTLDTNLLRDGERLETLIDVDRDPGTGEPASGADVAVDVVGDNGRHGRLVVRRWDAPSGGFADAGVPASAAAFRSGSRDVVWTLPAPHLGVDPAAPVRLAVVARHEAELDRAPEAGATFLGRAGAQTAPWPAAGPRASAGLPILRPTQPVAAGPAFGPLTLRTRGLVPSRGRLLVRMAWRGGRGGSPGPSGSSCPGAAVGM